MPIFNNILAGAAGQTAGGADAGYKIERSLRFNSADSAYLNRTPSSAGNRKTWTWSGWVKRSSLGSRQQVFGAVTSGSVFGAFEFNSLDSLTFYENALGSSSVIFTTNRLFRDLSAWYHIVLALDTTASTDATRVKLYINGIQETSFSAGPSVVVDGNGLTNSTAEHNIGSWTPASSSLNLDAYLADIHFIDGQALAETDFGEYDDNGVWQPKAYSGTYGTNGFHLDFSDNSSNAALGTDSSGNSNTWTVNNLSIGSPPYIAQLSSDTTDIVDRQNLFDGSTATATSGAAGGTITFTPSPAIQCNTSLRVYMAVDRGQSIFVNGTELLTSVSAGWNSVPVTTPLTINTIAIGPANVGSSNNPAAIEVDGSILVDSSSDIDSLIDSPTNYTADSGNNGGNYPVFNPLYTSNSGSWSNGNLEASVTGIATRGQEIQATMAIPSSGKWYFEITPTDTSGGKIGIGLHGDSSAPYATARVAMYRASGNINVNGTNVSSSVVTYANEDVIGVAVDADNDSVSWYKNNSLVNTQTSVPNIAGSIPGFSQMASSGTCTAVGNFGQRPFAYTPPTGYKSLCTTNLPDPTIADGSTAFDTKLWSGDGSSSRDITGYNFSPDFAWIKTRNSGSWSHCLFDQIRGNAVLHTNLTNAETATHPYGYLSAFTSDGFTLAAGASGDEQVNDSALTYVGWAWDAGTSTVSNTDGSITSSVRANPSAGFSIVSYTADGTVSTIGHGLNAAPQLIIGKSRDGAYNWMVGHDALGWTKYINLNTTSDATTTANAWNDTSPTSSVFTIGSNNNQLNRNGDDYIAYCFAPVEGYSEFGSYTGNGVTDGPFVYTGFRPQWLMVKTSTATYGWLMVDAVRNTFNYVDNYLYANSNAGELSNVADLFTFMANGFKVGNSSASNTNGATFVYAAFAEHPFKTARAR